MRQGNWIRWLLVMAVGCGPKAFLLPGTGEDDWPQSGGQADGRAFRPAGVEPPLLLLWTRQLDAPPVGGALLEGSLLLQLTTRPSLFALDRRTGQQWGKQGFDRAFCGFPALAGELLILAKVGKEGRLLGLDRRTRKVRWSYPGRFCTDLAVVGDTLLAAGDAGVLVALRAGDGEVLWQAEIGGRLWTGPSAGDGVICVGSGDGSLVALAAASGKEVWRQSLGSGVRSRPLMVGGEVFVGTAAGRVVGFASPSGERLWETSLGALLTPGMAGGPGILVVGATDRRLYGLELDSGRVRWQFATEGVVRGAPAATAATAYCGSSDSHLYALELDSGRLRWKYRLDSPVLGPVALDERSVVVTSEKGTVYVFGRE